MKKTLSISQANILYLITMVLVVVAGGFLQTASLAWGLIVTEALLILLPVVLVLRKNGIPLREGLRLRPIGPGLAALSVLIGIATWFYVAYIDALVMQISGLPPVATESGALPVGIIESAAYFAAMAVFAPVCEETLFRGAIQGAYERRRSAAYAIAITSLLFAFYHFRPTGLFALLPVAFTLGYIGWRTQSLVPVILVHFGNNAASALTTLLALNVEGFELSIINTSSAAAALAVALGLLFALTRIVPAPTLEAQEAAETPPVPRSSWMKLYWPLIAAGLVFAVVSGATLISAFNPKWTAERGVTFQQHGWTQPVQYRYTITNRLEDEVGEAVCTITPETEVILLECSSSTEGYEIKTDSSYFSESTHTLEWSAAWDAETLALEDFDLKRLSESGEPVLNAALDGTQLTMTGPDLFENANLGEDLLLGHEWAWRFAFAEGDASAAHIVAFGYLLTWDEEVQRSRPVAREELARFFPPETITVPAGQFDAWKVTIANNKAAWYSSGDLPVLLRYDDGMSVYSLVE